MVGSPAVVRAARRGRALLALLLPAAVVVRALAASRPELVERLYAQGLFPLLAGPLAALSALAPFSLAEPLLLVAVVVALAWSFRVARALWQRERPALRVLGGAALDALAVAGAAAALFLALWGLNYQRPPLAALAGLAVAPAPADELAALLEELVSDANAARRALPEDAAGVLRLAPRPQVLERTAAGFAAAAARHRFLAGPPGRPKPALLSALLARLGIVGIYVPFTAEPLVNTTVPDPELPFAAAHELAHLRGLAREDEANFAAWLACRAHPDPAFRYAGALAASLYASGALRGVDPEWAGRLEAVRSEAVARDVAALAAWSRRYEGRASHAARRVNDAYLRSQGEARGVASYGRMVDLLLAERRARGASGS